MFVYVCPVFIGRRLFIRNYKVVHFCKIVCLTICGTDTSVAKETKVFETEDLVRANVLFFSNFP